MVCNRSLSQLLLVLTCLVFTCSATRNVPQKSAENDENSQNLRHLTPVDVFDLDTNTQPDSSISDTDPSIILNGETAATDELALFSTYDISKGAAQVGADSDLDNCDEVTTDSAKIPRRKGWRRGEGSKYYKAGCSGSHKISKSKKSKKKKHKRRRGKGKGYHFPLGHAHKRTKYPSPTASPTSAVETLEPTLVPTPPSTLGSDGPSLVPSFGSTQPSIS